MPNPILNPGIIKDIYSFYLFHVSTIHKKKNSLANHFKPWEHKKRDRNYFKKVVGFNKMTISI